MNLLFYILGFLISSEEYEYSPISWRYIFSFVAVVIFMTGITILKRFKKEKIKI